MKINEINSGIVYNGSITKIVFSANLCSNGHKTCVPHVVNTSNKTCVTKHQNANKEALLEDVLEFKLTEVIDKLNELDFKIENAVDRMFCRDEEIEKAAQSNNSLLIRQLIKYYPAIFNNT